MFTEKDKTSPTREFLITVDELYHLLSLLMDHYDSYPLDHRFDKVRDFDKRLGTGLHGLWLYWSKRTKDTSRFVLTIKR